MTPFALYCLQILLVVAAGAAASAVVRLTPRLRFTYWRLVVAVCLALPLMPPRVIEIDLMTAAEQVIASVGPVRTAAIGQADPRNVAALVPIVLLAGALLRGAWLIAGLIQLRRLNREGEPVALDEEIGPLQRILAPRAEIRWHARVAQPVTFGVRRPIVLLPFKLKTLDAELRRSVVCHELLHADRGDWIATVVEEIVRTAFWFHPAMWWAIGQIQLSREETVDALAVAMTGSRRSYLQALLAFADSPALAPAPPFIRRHQLAQRIKQVSQEVVMSPMRLVIGAFALAAFTGSSAWAIASTLPLRTEVRYRPAAAATTEMSPEPLNATRQQPPRTMPPPPPPPPPRPASTMPPPPPPPPPLPADGSSSPRVLTETKPTYPAEALRYSPGAMVWVKVNIGANGEVTEAKAARWRLTIENSIEDPNYWASKPERAFIDAAETAALEWKFAAPDANTKRAVELMFTFRNFPGAAAGGVQAVAAPGGATVVRVGGNIRPPVKVRDVRAAYPEAARAAHVQGVVILEVRLGVDGSVVDTKVVRSIPLLDEAAVDSVRQWRYAPTLLNGEPVEVIMTVTVSFMAS